MFHSQTVFNNMCKGFSNGRRLGQLHRLIAPAANYKHSWWVTMATVTIVAYHEN